ncbi:MAG: pyruvate kinase [Actinomycetota bacterium]|nr:pyruvate kinase [Actinomycetota bacterium]
MTAYREAEPLLGDDTRAELVRLLDGLDELIGRLEEAGSVWSTWIGATGEAYRPSALNLAHYWAMRGVDLRDLQHRLAAFGLSSLGRSEPHVEATLRLVRSAVLAMISDSWCPPAPCAVGYDQSRTLLDRRTTELLGPVPAGRTTRIMVTLPSEAAGDPDLVRRLVERGMDVARINCAHDGPEAWRAMARHVRTAAEQTSRSVLIAMDLAGPKLRTGPIQPGARVVKLRPSRDDLGHVVAPAHAWLTPESAPAAPPEPGMVVLPVPGEWLARRRSSDILAMYDTRGAKRTLLPVATHDAGVVVSTDKTAYVASGTVLRVYGRDDPAEVGALPQHEQSLLLRPGDVLHLTRDCSPAPADVDGVPRIGCTLDEVFGHARPGEKVFFDDGKIGGEVTAVHPDLLEVRIERAAGSGSKLRAAKGINLPDTTLPVPALTDKDIADLSTVVEIADLVQLSFVQQPRDVEQLHTELARLGGGHVGVVLKIETRRAFERLPQLLLAAMRRPRVGVMIARGDLAVEVGYQRLAELQEEILWLCEAAHLPVIWATQVLEQLSKSGLPSRAEISDAAMGERAECVMLNKGPHIDEAVVVLDDILTRMAGHHYKKNALLPQLHSWYGDQPTARDSG